MATLSKLRIVLEVGTAGVAAGMKKVETSLHRLGARMKTLAATSFSLRNALAGLAGGGFVAKQLFEMGSAVEETGSKFATVFGESSDSVQGFIDNFATMAGLSNTAAQDVLATTGAIAQGMGFAQDASAKFATEIVRVAGDLSSFNNIPIAETALAVQAALTGEREQLKRMGIVVREVDVQQQAFANTGKTVAATLTNQEKATATLQLITQRAGFAIGDLERTQDSAANKARATAAEMKNIADTISVALLPVLSFVITKFSEFIKGIQIMAAESAVFIARVNFWKEAFLGTEASIMAANDQLRFMRIAAEEVKNEIVGLTNTVQDFNTSTKAIGETKSGGSLKVDMSGLTETTLTLGTNIDRVAVSVQNNLRPSLRSATGQMEELRDTAVGFADSFARAVIDSTESGIDAFRRFADEVIKELLRIQIRAAFLNFVGSLGGSGGTGNNIGDIVNSSLTPNGIPTTTSGATMAGTKGNVVNNTFSFNVNAIDSRDVGQFFQENAGKIQGIVSEGARSSTSFRRSLRGGR